MSALVAAIALIAAQSSPELFPRDEPQVVRHATMERELTNYFKGELAESYVWAELGLVGLGSSIGLLVNNQSLGRPMAVPIGVLSLVQLALGIGLWLRTPGQVARLSAQLTEDPVAFAIAERERMRGVNTGFKIYRIVELGLLFTGLGGVAGAGWINRDDNWLGVGLGLAIECVVFLALDYFADERGARYEAALLSF